MLVVPVIYDGYARIRNSVIRNRPKTILIYSKFTVSVLDLLYNLGYLSGYKLIFDEKYDTTAWIEVYFNSASKSLIRLDVLSKPSRRIYVGYKELMGRHYSGFELVVLSTSKGILTRSECVMLKIGGELLFKL